MNKGWHVTMFSHARDHHTLTASDESFTIEVRGSNRVAIQVMHYLQQCDAIDRKLHALNSALGHASKVFEQVKHIERELEAANHYVQKGVWR